jgi:hypothetical protein
MIELLGEDWCDSFEDSAINKALDYKIFYQEKKRKPAVVLTRKTKEQKDNASKEQKHEHRLAQWFNNMRTAKKGKGNMKLYPSVEKILIDIFGSDWFR